MEKCEVSVCYSSSFNQYLLSSCYVPCIMIGAGMVHVINQSAFHRLQAGQEVLPCLAMPHPHTHIDEEPTPAKVLFGSRLGLLSLHRFIPKCRKLVPRIVLSVHCRNSAGIRASLRRSVQLSESTQGCLPLVCRSNWHERTLEFTTHLR